MVGKCLIAVTKCGLGKCVVRPRNQTVGKKEESPGHSTFLCSVKSFRCYFDASFARMIVFLRVLIAFRYECFHFECSLAISLIRSC